MKNDLVGMCKEVVVVSAR